MIDNWIVICQRLIERARVVLGEIEKLDPISPECQALAREFVSIGDQVCDFLEMPRLSDTVREASE